MPRAPTEPYDLQAQLFRGLGDRSRLAILETLRGGPIAVGEIVAITGFSQPNTSNHLRCLSECGLVTAEQQGRYVYYRLSDARIGKLLALADSLLAEIGRQIYACTNYRTASSQAPGTARTSRSRQRVR